MPEYLVIWEIEVQADSPEDAATQALEIQRDPNSIATTFDVVDDYGEITEVYLDEAER